MSIPIHRHTLTPLAHLVNAHLPPFINLLLFPPSDILPILNHRTLLSSSHSLKQRFALNKHSLNNQLNQTIFTKKATGVFWKYPQPSKSQLLFFLELTIHQHKSK